MPRPSAAQKQDAARASRSWDRFAHAIGIATAGAATGLGSVDSVLSTELLKVGALLFAMAKACSAEAKGVADDPPRDDFESATYPYFRKIDFSVFGEGPIVTPAVHVGLAAGQSSAYLRAMVRALERAEGAARRDRPQLRDLRASEARRFAEEASAALRELAGGTRTLQHAFETFARSDEGVQPEGPPKRSTIWARLDETLPDSSLALAFRAGIRIEELRRSIRGAVPDNPAAELTLRAGEAAEEAEGFAERLEGGTFEE